MDTATAAIIVSSISAALAGLSLGWNIYRDVILKARLDVIFGVRTLVSHGKEDHPDYVLISATNFGPGVSTVSMIHAKNAPLIKRIFGKSEHAVIMNDYSTPLSGQLPARLEVGEKVDLLLPYNEDCLLNRDWTHVGLYDNFGKSHWCKPRHVKEARERWLQDFGPEVT